MSTTERELAPPDGNAPLHGLPMAFADLGTALQLSKTVGMLGKVYGKC